MSVLESAPQLLQQEILRYEHGVPWNAPDLPDGEQLMLGLEYLISLCAHETAREGEGESSGSTEPPLKRRRRDEGPPG
jgi:hypothetical protein